MDTAQQRNRARRRRHARRAGAPGPGGAGARRGVPHPGAGRTGSRSSTRWCAGRGRIPEDAAPGAGFEKLTRTHPDGIRVRPLYTAEDAPDPATAGVPGGARSSAAAARPAAAPDGWDVRQRHAEPDPTAARAAVLADLENGVTSIWLAVGEGGTAVADLPAVLDGVHLDLAPVVLDASADTADTELAAEAFLALARTGVAPTTCSARSASTRWAAAPAPAPGRTRRRRRRSPGGWPRSSRRSARSSWTRCRSTRRAAPTPRSSGSRSPPGSPTCGR